MADERVKVQDVLVELGLARGAGHAGASEKSIADNLAGLAGVDAGLLAGGMTLGKAAGESLGIGNKSKTSHRIAAPYSKVLRAMLIAMTSGSSGLTAAFDTAQGAYLEGTMPKDMLSLGGTVMFDIIDRGEAGCDIDGAAEITGQMFAFGKGKRTIAQIVDRAQGFVRRL